MRLTDNIPHPPHPPAPSPDREKMRSGEGELWKERIKNKQPRAKPAASVCSIVKETQSKGIKQTGSPKCGLCHDLVDHVCCSCWLTAALYRVKAGVSKRGYSAIASNLPA